MVRTGVVYLQRGGVVTRVNGPLQSTGCLIDSTGQAFGTEEHLNALAYSDLQLVFCGSFLGNFLHIQPEDTFSILRQCGCSTRVQYAQHLLAIRGHSA